MYNEFFSEDKQRFDIMRLHIQNGVKICDPYSTIIDAEVKIGKGTVIYPSCVIQGNTVIGENCVIGLNTRLADMEIADNVSIESSVCVESRIGENTHVGPFAYIRPHCDIADNVKIGDFVEIKNSTIKSGSKASHLTYIGDSDVGERVNFGCGTITVNYDGAKKYRSTIEDDVFIGCNTNIVSPVKVGKGAYIAAGSTITDDVPEKSLAIARARQVVKEGWKKPEKEKKQAENTRQE